MNKYLIQITIYIRGDKDMKKALIVLFFIILVYSFLGVYINENVKIPDDAIRIRILANSNSDYDQKIKKEVKNNIQDYMYSLLNTAKNSEEAKRIIIKNLNNINNEVDTTLQEFDYNIPFKINFGLNYFPKKEYKGIVYDEGYYNSLLITLGSGFGDNWWCVLFPPLCLIEAEESSEVEYASFVKEILDKYV